MVRAAAAALPLFALACSSRLSELKADPQAHVKVGSVVAAAAGEGGSRLAEVPKEPLADDPRGRCPAGMVDIEGRYCIDRYEASLVEVLPGGKERPFSPYSTIGARRVRAVSEANVVPQGYISATQAKRACAAAGKRLCRVDEWQTACRGPDKSAWSYGDRREPGRCNDRGRNPIMSLYGPRYTSWTMNQPALNQVPGTLARTGEREGCTNGYGVFDMIGNLHEWVADPRGSFYGGYYQDVQSLGHGAGCSYATTAHSARYHDYSTGFRCCADVGGGKASAPAGEGAPSRAKPPRQKKRQKRRR